MADTKTLLQYLMDLLHDPEALASFRADPQAFLERAGLGDVSVDDIKHLLPTVLEHVNPSHCAAYEDACDSGNCYDSHCEPTPCDPHGASHCDPQDDNHCYTPCADHHSDYDQVVQHLNFVANNFCYIDPSHEVFGHEGATQPTGLDGFGFPSEVGPEGLPSESYETHYTTNDVSHIFAGEDSTVDVTNQTANLSGGSSLVLGDNNAPITPGDGNVVGDGNQVAGAGSTASFGDGSALHGVTTGDGGAISIGGDATGSHTDPTLFNGDGTAAIGGDATDSHTIGIADSGNETQTLDESDNSTHETTVDNSGNDNSQETDNSVDGSNNMEFHA